MPVPVHTSTHVGMPDARAAACDSKGKQAPQTTTHRQSQAVMRWRGRIARIVSDVGRGLSACGRDHHVHGLQGQRPAPAGSPSLAPAV